MVVSEDGMKVGDDRVKIVRHWPKPTSLTELRSFVGLLQFFRIFIHDFSRIAAPLTNLTRKGSGIHAWNSNCDVAFAKLRRALVSAPIIAPPDWGKTFYCHTDACQVSVGGTLTQLESEGRDRAIAYFSRRLTPAEENYTANDRELLALVYFLKRFRCYLEGASFDIITDNQVLKNFLSKPDLSRLEARWLDLFAHFGISNIMHKAGRFHILGDVLSRAPHAPLPEISNVETLEVQLPEGFTSNYERDGIFGPIVRALEGGWQKESILRRRIERLLPHFKMVGDRLYYESKLCVPRDNVSEILFLAHDCPVAGHFAFHKVLARLERFHWKHKPRDITRYCRGYLTCQSANDGRRKPLGTPQPLAVPSRRWGTVSTDFITQLPVTARGHDAITTFVDCFTKRVHFIPSKCSDRALESAKNFYDHELMNLCGVTLALSTGAHPQTDGMSEIMNRVVENYLRCYCNLQQSDWDSLLTAAEFAYNSASVASLQLNPFELDLGWMPKSPLDCLLGHSEVQVESVRQFQKRMVVAYEDARYSQRLAKAQQAAYNSRKPKPIQYKEGDQVWLSNRVFTDAVSKLQGSRKLRVKRYGPFTVLKLIGKNAVRLDLPAQARVHPVVHVEHTSPHFNQRTSHDLNLHPRHPYAGLTGQTNTSWKQFYPTGNEGEATNGWH
eukprot:IDg1356t1